MPSDVPERPCRHCGRWTPDEDALLRHLYPRAAVGEIVARLGRPPMAIRQRARRLGVRRLRVLAPGPVYRGCGRRKPVRPWGLCKPCHADPDVRRRIADADPRRMSDEDVALIRRLFRDTPTEHLATLVGRTPDTLRCKARSLGLTRLGGLAAEYGLPTAVVTAVGVRGLQLLLALAAGPRTAAELTAALALRDRCGKPLRRLMRNGLVSRLPGRPRTYFLTPHSLDLLSPTPEELPHDRRPAD